MPVKPLSFKGDKKSKKRKHRDGGDPTPNSLVRTSHTNHDNDADDDQVQPDPTSREDDTWTHPDQPSDINGPVLLVLPTVPPTCLGSDAHGSVFASQLENIVEGHAETAEPHDVRQVWVANVVAGTGQISFKASHGGFLSCDALGVLGARREARGVEEGFVIEPAEGGGRERWRVKTAASKDGDGKEAARYICAIVEESLPGAQEGETKKKVSISLRGDGEAGSETTQLILKMQARFKPRLQQNKETKAREKVSRRELEQVVGRKLEDDEVKRLKRARKDGTYHEEILDVRVKGKHDKYAS